LGIKWAKFDETAREIFLMLYEYPDGLGANEICRRIERKGLGSHPLVLNTLKSLHEKEKCLEINPDKTHSQKKLYKIKESYKQVIQNYNILIEHQNWLAVYLARLNYVFEKDLVKKEKKKEYFDDFIKNFIQLASQIFVLAECLSEPFPPNFKGSFFYVAHQTFRGSLQTLRKIVGKYQPNIGELKLTLNPELKINELIEKNAFLNWVEKSNSYTDKEKKILSTTFQPTYNYQYKSSFKSH